MEPQLDSFRIPAALRSLWWGKAKEIHSVSSLIMEQYTMGFTQPCPPRATSCPVWSEIPPSVWRSQPFHFLKLGMTYQARDGDKFTSSSQGLRVASIRTSKPYSSENTTNGVTFIHNSTTESPKNTQFESLLGYFHPANSSGVYWSL